MVSSPPDNPPVSNHKTKHGYGVYLIVLVLVAGGYNRILENIQPHSLSTAVAVTLYILLALVNTTVLYVFALWVSDVWRRRGGTARPDNRKARLIIGLVCVVAFLLMVVSVLTSAG